MENFRQATIELLYDDEKAGLNKTSLKQLDKYLKCLNNVFKKENQNFAELCFYVYQVRALFYGNKYCHNKKGQVLMFNSIMQQFGLNDTEISRLCSCYDKFIETTLSEDRITITSYKIKEIFFPFSKSKLFELLPVENSQLETDIKNKVLRDDMSVASIREYVKNYKALQKANKKITDEKEDEAQEEINEDEIPMAYDPKKYYDFKYFEEKNKAQLLNMIWDLQKEYQKLKKEIKK